MYPQKLFLILAAVVTFVSRESVAMLSSTATEDFIHVQGDSNTAGVYPGPSSEWNVDLSMGRIMEFPWPIIMEKELRKNGFAAIVHNHGESNRHLTCETAPVGITNSGAQADGRVGLQQIIVMMMNRGGERNKKNTLIINLGTNDLQPEGITEAQLVDKLLLHVITILANPYLQYSLLGRLNEADRPLAFEFMKQLSPLIARALSHQNTDTKLISFVREQRTVIQKLFGLIHWHIIIVPPVLITGHPFDSFKSSELSARWPEIVEKVVEFIGSPRVIALKGAQNFAIPHTDEFGGMVHFDEADHREFGTRAAQFLSSVLKTDSNE